MGGKGNRYTREYDERKRAFRNEQICERFLAGASVNEIAKEFGLSGGTVNGIVYELRAPAAVPAPVPVERIALTPARVRELASVEPTNAVVYFVQDGDFVKIGASTAGRSLMLRVAGLQVGNPRELVLRCVIAGDLEREFHEHFAKQRVRGEWFRIDDEIEAFMVEAAAATEARAA